MATIEKPAMERRHQHLVLDFLAYLEFERGLSRNTLEAYRSDLLQFGRFLEERGVSAVDADAGDVGRPSLESAALPPLQEATELQQIRPVGLQRVPREAALELEVGEEVEHEVLEATLGAGAFDGCHTPADFARRARIPWLCKTGRIRSRFSNYLTIPRQARRYARNQSRPTSVFESRQPAITSSSSASGVTASSMRSLSSASACSSKRSVAR